MNEQTEREAAIRARLDAVTPGEWETDGEYVMLPWNDDTGAIAADVATPANAKFFAHAPADVAYLLAQLDEARRVAAVLAEDLIDYEGHCWHCHSNLESHLPTCPVLKAQSWRE
jgi:hypothetical protein